MKSPVTYAEWMSCLDSLRSDSPENELLDAMSQGSIAWTSAVAEGIAAEIASVLEFRLKRCTVLLQRDIGVRVSDSGHVSRCLLDARRRIDTARRIASLRPLPEYVRSGLEQSVTTWADRCQSSLEESARHDRTGTLLDHIRRTPLNRTPAPEPPRPRLETCQSVPSGGAAASRPVRRIILT